MHIQENVTLTIPVESVTGNTGFDRTDSELGVCLVAASDALATDSNATRAAKSYGADQPIIGTVGGEGDICKAKGEIVFQVKAAFTAAQMAAGLIQTTTTVGKIEPGTVANFAANKAIKVNLTRQGTDPKIGFWVAAIL